MFRALNDTAGKASKDDPRTRTARRFDALVDFVLPGASLPPACQVHTTNCTGSHASPAEGADDSPTEGAHRSPPGDSYAWSAAGAQGCSSAQGCPPAPKIP